MGTDNYRVDLPQGYILKEAYIAEAIAAADVLITLSHFKGHPIGVIGGAIKNLGIGAQSRRGKFNVHMGGHPRYGFGANIFHPRILRDERATKTGEPLKSLVHSISYMLPRTRLNGKEKGVLTAWPVLGL